MIIGPSRRHYTRRATRVLIALAFLFCVLYMCDLLDFTTRRFDTWNWTACPGTSPFDTSCEASRRAIAQDVQVILRTGGSESLDRIRTHLATVLAPVPRRNILIFSDLEEEIGSFHIHDAYADISQVERDRYPEFALYDLQKEYKRQGKDTRELQGGWTLGKYMNLPIKRKVWEWQQHQSRKQWFVFIETDTFIEWDNLFELLAHLDASKKLYIGSPVWLPDLQFAHGGSAYVLSAAALSTLNNPRSQDKGQDLFHSQYGVNVTGLCCGDEALARASKLRGITLNGYWPLFNGETPVTIPFGKEIWCEPIISMHHIAGADLESLSSWVETWKSKNAHPLAFNDLYGYIAPHLTSEMKMDWDNTDDDWKIYAKGKYSSFKQCKALCEQDSACFQYVLHGTSCALSHQIRLGRKREPRSMSEDRYQSGWNMDRINGWTTHHKCETTHWVKSNP